MRQSNPYPMLVVEDNPSDLFMLQRALKRAQANISLYVVSNGYEAVDYLLGNGMYVDREDYPFPVVVTSNYRMPRMTGLELLKWIRQQSDFQQLPVVIMSADMDEIREQTKVLGANACFAKSRVVSELSDCVSTILSLLPKAS